MVWVLGVDSLPLKLRTKYKDFRTSASEAQTTLQCYFCLSNLSWLFPHEALAVCLSPAFFFCAIRGLEYIWLKTSTIVAQVKRLAWWCGSQRWATLNLSWTWGSLSCRKNCTEILGRYMSWEKQMLWKLFSLLLRVFLQVSIFWKDKSKWWFSWIKLDYSIFWKIWRVQLYMNICHCCLNI